MLNCSSAPPNCDSKVLREVLVQISDWDPVGRVYLVVEE
jgi:hypothetical protein